ncbi:MAG TPA: nucleotidyltransferase [Verrucomicrobiota bacterium]|nr:nucleotidyltransferase [Verrucomicrobiales bacterium]HRI12448.1 nucleotidyltransferase [Verrucomicrobiota bacterium]
MSDRSIAIQPIPYHGLVKPQFGTPSEQYERKRAIGGYLELICQELELPETKRSAAESAYHAVGKWLDECPIIGRFKPKIFVQGSVAHQTTVKPRNGDDFDVDLVCHLSMGDESLPQAAVKKAIGDRLRSHGTYGPMLSEYRRCWRLDYSKESQLHLDITPAVNNSKCTNGGLCVTDREARAWQPSHPKAFVDWFAYHGLNQPKFEVPPFCEDGHLRAEVASFPKHTPLKGLLRRSVQLFKRHRCLHFRDRLNVAPISVILTALSAESYAEAALSDRVYPSELDLVCDVIARMPNFIERRWNGSRIEWWVPNKTTEGENFADKWNHNQALPEAFWEWHGAASRHFQALAESGDGYPLFATLAEIGGEGVVKAAQSRVVEAVSAARANRTLRVAPAGTLGLATGITVEGNTFFGS